MTMKLQIIVKATRTHDGDVIVEPLYLGLSAGDAQAAWDLARATIENCELRWYKNPDPVYIRKRVLVQPEAASETVSLGNAPAVLPDGGAPGDTTSPDDASAGGTDGESSPPRKRRAAADA